MKKNNFKRAAALSMSLAMVMTVLPTSNVFAAEDFDLATICTEGSGFNTNCGLALFSLIDEQLKELDYSFDEVGLQDGKIKADEATLTLFQAINTYRDGLKAYGIMNKEDREVVDAYIETVDLILEMFNNALDASPAAAAEQAGLVKEINDAMDGDKEYEDVPSKAELREYKEKLAKFEKAYDLDLSSRLGGEYEEAMDKAYDLLESFVYEFVDEDEEYADFVMAWEKVLEGDLDGDDFKLDADEAYLTGLEEGVNNPIDLGSKSAIKDRIEQLKDSPYYKDFEEEYEVEDILATYEELLDSVESLADIVKEDAYKAYTKDRTSDERTSVKNFIYDALEEEFESVSTVDDYSKSAVLDETEYLMSILDSEQYAVLQDLMEDVVNVAWDYEIKESRGRYVDKSDWVSGVSASQQNTLSKNIPALFFVMVDTEEGLSGWDMIEAHMEEFNKAWEAVTTGLEGIDQFSLKASDGEAIYAADDALYELTEGGIFENNLTSSQEKQLRRIEQTVNRLKTTYILSGLNPDQGDYVSNWVDLGNGNWDYVEPNGTRPTKWICSAKDTWYYVKDGHMLRNTWIARDASATVWYYVGNDGKMVYGPTVIDGFTIDANGEYRV